MKHILVVVEKDEGVRVLMARHLKTGFPEAEINVAGEPDFACLVIEELIRCGKSPNLVFTNFSMFPHHSNGLKVIRLCQEHAVPVVLVSSGGQDHGDFRVARELVGSNFVQKPFEAKDVISMAKKVLDVAKV